MVYTGIIGSKKSKPHIVKKTWILNGRVFPFYFFQDVQAKIIYSH